MDLDFKQITADLNGATEAFFKIAAMRITKEIFQGNLGEWKVMFLGDKPFTWQDLEQLGRKMGILYLEQGEAQIIVVLGREGFYPEVIDQLVSPEAVIEVEFCSQEDFLNFWLFGKFDPYDEGDLRIEEHPGLKYLASIGDYTWPWPDTEVIPGDGETDTDAWQTEHILRTKYGYTVNKQIDLTDKQRQQQLDNALQELTLQVIVEHIAFLVRMRKARHDRQSYTRAINKWERDLTYLQSKYYKKQFVWPRLEP